jgi:uncharacterized membrane protein YphA (DoxX/SURF4 family)
VTLDGVVRRGGQALLGGVFVKLGWDAARDPGKRVDTVANAGVPRADVAVRVNGAAMVAGGAALIAGVLPRAAALGLIASMIPTTAVGHGFWRHEGADRTMQMVQFAKNAAIVGGLLVVAGSPRPARS